jgi:large subunit ribosomal protein L15
VSPSDKSSVSRVNLCDLQRLCDAKILSADQEVNIDTLKSVGIVRKTASKFRLLAKGELKVALKISAGYASDTATRGIEGVGGQVTIV